MMLIISQISFFSMVIFLMTSHPLTLGFILMILSVMFSILIFLSASSTWMSFVLMMVFLSGSMVIFIYMTSISSNEIIDFKFKYTPIMAALLLIYALNYWFLPSPAMKSLNPLNNAINSNSMEMIYKTYNISLNFFTLFMIIYLLLMMIVAVKITIMSKTPLRS